MKTPDTETRRGSGILRRITLMSWLVVLMSMTVFALYLTYQQRQGFLSDMADEASRVATEIGGKIGPQVRSRQNLSKVVDMCQNFLKQNTHRELLYIAVTMTDGPTLMNWRAPDRTDNFPLWEEREGRSNLLNPPETGKNPLAQICDVPPVDLGKGIRSLHVSTHGVSDGTPWGWIHIGMSTRSYDKAAEDIRRYVALSGTVVLVFGALAAYVLARNLTRPIQALQSFAHRVAGGALNARVSVKAEGELGDLADSINKMVESLEQSQQRIRESVKQQASLREKEILLREIHHRVKNNMQILTSLLRLQTRQADSEELRNVLRESEARIRSMGLLHDKLYQSESVSVIDMLGYLRTLTGEIIRMNTPPGTKRDVKLAVTNVNLGLDTALPCGLIITELVTNALKYAFPGRPEGIIYVSLSSPAEHEFHLTVWDNGVGMPADFDLTKATSLGMRLVKMLTDQLHGRLAIDGSNGTRVEVIFRESEYKHRL